MKRRRRQPARKQPVIRYDRNNYIKAEKMRVIDQEGENIGILTKREALQRAEEADLDLVLISPNEDTPVAKIVDWSKFKYTQSKKQKNKAKSVTVKEWWFKPKIEMHDIEVKLGQAQKYLEKGSKVKITIRSKKRTTREDMYNTLEKILEVSEPFAEKISDVNKEGRNISVFLKAKQ